ncbi:MAG: MmoB/DmpM family protein [Deltaproteobacteria bacterium]|nr:MmoB/DmpM family protein [Deltaproteobacteria bacterium]
MSTFEGKKVAIVLMKSEEADATIDALERERRDVEVTDHGTYWHIAAKDEIVVSMEKVGQELGRPIDLGQWLVIMSTFVGRAAPGPDYFRVTSKMVELEAGA